MLQKASAVENAFAQVMKLSTPSDLNRVQVNLIVVVVMVVNS